MPRASRIAPRARRCTGFTLFEMVVAICVIVILYMVAEQRLNELPAAAERANFYGVLEQLKTAVNFAMVSKMAEGKYDEAGTLEGINPMSLLLEAPSNYNGELMYVTDAVESRNAWYFETATGELVYVVGGASIEDVWVTVANIPVNLGQIRFKVGNVYSNGVGTPLDNEGTRGQWEGISLQEVRNFSWDRRPEQPVELN